MDGPERDEPVKIDLESEEAPKIMESGRLPEYSVELTDAEADEPRTLTWRGHAPDAEAARVYAEDDWSKHYGDRPNLRADVRSIGINEPVPQDESAKKQGDELDD
jgi:hypothetical protein